MYYELKKFEEGYLEREATICGRIAYGVVSNLFLTGYRSIRLKNDFSNSEIADLNCQIQEKLEFIMAGGSILTANELTEFFDTHYQEIIDLKEEVENKQGVVMKMPRDIREFLVRFSIVQKAAQLLSEIQ